MWAQRSLLPDDTRLDALLTGLRRLAADVVLYNWTQHPLLSLESHENRLVLFGHASEDQTLLRVLYIRDTYFNDLPKNNVPLLAITAVSKIPFSCACCLEHTPLSAPILFKGNNGCTRAVSTIFPGGQQTGIPKENSGQQPRRQTLVQIMPENPEKAFASSMRSPLLFVLFQQNCEVSSVMVARALAGCVR